MAEEKKKKDKNLFLKINAGCISLLAIIIVIINEYEKYDEKKAKPIVGEFVKIDEDALAYRNITDAINETNGIEKYYDEGFDRKVITAYYKVDDQFVRINMQDNYLQQEKEIINKNGELVGVLTTIDLENKTPEAYYNSKDIIKNKKNKVKIKTKIRI